MKPDATRTALNILLPTDFSPGSGRALPVALSLSERLGADLHLLYVLSEGSELTASEVRARLDTLRLDYRYSLPSSRAGRLRAVVIHEKDGASGILNYAKLAHVQLIVMAHRGSAYTESPQPGSVTMAVMAEAPMPVLAVPRGAHVHAQPEKVVLLDQHPHDVSATVKMWLDAGAEIDQVSTDLPVKTDAHLAVLPFAGAMNDMDYAERVYQIAPNALLLSPPKPTSVPAFIS